MPDLDGTFPIFGSSDSLYAEDDGLQEKITWFFYPGACCTGEAETMATELSGTSELKM